MFFTKYWEISHLFLHFHPDRGEFDAFTSLVLPCGPPPCAPGASSPHALRMRFSRSKHPSPVIRSCGSCATVCWGILCECEFEGLIRCGVERLFLEQTFLVPIFWEISSTKTKGIYSWFHIFLSKYGIFSQGKNALRACWYFVFCVKLSWALRKGILIKR